jgi:selenocysteine lyase/cysteine desulfurase
MKSTRRSFLGLASGSALAAACATRGATSGAVSAAPAVGRWAALREDFLLAKDRIHLGNLLIASNPRPVREAVDAYRKLLDENPVDVLEEELHSGARMNATLDSAARYMGVAPDEIALTDSTTSGLSIVYGGLALEKGDEVVTTKHDHFVTHEALRLVAERSGATIKTVALYDEAREAKAETMAKAIEAAISPATRVVAVTWVQSCTGVKTPIRMFADVVARANGSRSGREKILLCVDGVHGFGVEAASIRDLGCDFFIAGCHKWIFGPRGTGVVWAKREGWERLRPQSCPFSWDYIAAREMGRGPTPAPSGRTMTPGGFRAYEHRWALREAFEYHLRLGKVDVQERIHELATRCKTGLAEMRHVKLHTPLDPAVSSGIITFEVAGMKVDDVVARLHKANIVATTTPYDPSYARFTPGLVNTPEEIDAALAATRQLA